MDNPNFTSTNLSKENEDAQLECKKVILDHDQLEYLKFSLTISDGFMFGLGVILACVVCSMVLFILGVFGISAMFHELGQPFKLF